MEFEAKQATMVEVSLVAGGGPLESLGMAKKQKQEQEQDLLFMEVMLVQLVLK